MEIQLNLRTRSLQAVYHQAPRYEKRAGRRETTVTAHSLRGNLSDWWFFKHIWKMALNGKKNTK